MDQNVIFLFSKGAFVRVAMQTLRHICEMKSRFSKKKLKFYKKKQLARVNLKRKRKQLAQVPACNYASPPQQFVSVLVVNPTSRSPNVQMKQKVAHMYVYTCITNTTQ